MFDCKGTNQLSEIIRQLNRVTLEDIVSDKFFYLIAISNETHNISYLKKWSKKGMSDKDKCIFKNMI